MPYVNYSLWDRLPPHPCLFKVYIYLRFIPNGLTWWLRWLKNLLAMQETQV